MANSVSLASMLGIVEPMSEGATAGDPQQFASLIDMITRQRKADDERKKKEEEALAKAFAQNPKGAALGGMPGQGAKAPQVASPFSIQFGKSKVGI